MKSKEKRIRVPYATTFYDGKEIVAVNAVLKRPNKMIVAGNLVHDFEAKIAKLFGKKHGVMVNSGSSANLIALEIAGLPKGAEVITPLLTFSTTLAPIVQKGLVPVFADVKMGTYQINEEQIEPLITKKTKALMIPSLIGNLPDFRKLLAIAKKHKLLYIEDSCDTLGGAFAGRPTGTYSDITTTSFYASHIVTAAGGGGMVCVNGRDLARRALVMSNWGRESTLFGAYAKSEDIRKRFSSKIGNIPYDAKFIFSEIGYNFQPSEIQAAFALENLKRLPEFTRRRRANFKRLKRFFGQYEDFFILPEEYPKASTVWLAFPLTIRRRAPFTRLQITKYLEKHNIQTRPIFTGNALKQPGFRRIHPFRARRGGYPVTDYVMKNSFLIGCHHGMTGKMFAHLFEVFGSFLKRQR
ncbi:MAG: aminotransferase class I/II-fold pyridoxal phosphate-dependent enzyme [Candidatus Liptonbacteria bacterium]|nr:aminotransferase class I/II-fold pyridoxal phosphate-dependent enzyme [Candidatus Liptonbacteria bacterium]